MKRDPAAKGVRRWKNARALARRLLFPCVLIARCRRTIPTAYEAINLQEGGINEPLRARAPEFECVARSGRDSVSYSPFAKAFAAAEFRTAAPSEALGLLVFAGSRLPSNGSPETDPLLPSEEVMKPLVEPEGFGIGYYAPWFWRAAFAYPSSQTRGVLC